MKTKRRKRRYGFDQAKSVIAVHYLSKTLAHVASIQVQPLSLEELLAKKKAEEEAEAKVRS